MPNVAGWFNGTEHVIRAVQRFDQKGEVLRITYGVHVRRLDHAYTISLTVAALMGMCCGEHGTIACTQSQCVLLDGRCICVAVCMHR